MLLRSPSTPASILCMLLAAGGCSSSSTPPATTSPSIFVGQVSGTDAQVAVVATATHARLYFCGGDASFTTKTHWIPSATLAGARLTLPAMDSAGWSVTGSLDESGASGSVTMGDAGVFSFHADRVVPGTIAGLYEAQNPCGKVGVIVSQSSATDAPASQGACLGSDGSGAPSVEQVNPIRPLARGTDGSIAVLVDTTQVLVSPAAPPAD